MKENKKEEQLEWLQKIFDTCMPPTPAFKSNHPDVPQGMTPYICCSDVFDRKYIIRIIPTVVFLSETDDSFEKKESGKIIAHYDSLEALVEDGWMLD